MSAKHFSEAARIVMEYEGGYSNDPDDPGGETKYGIAKKFYPDLDIKNLTKEQALEIYKRDYWDKFKGDEITSGDVCIELLDIALNLGPKTAILFLQDALNHVSRAGLEVDGTMGPLTLRAVNSCNKIEALVTVLNGLQFTRYHDLVHRNPRLEKFFVGWLTRIKFRKLASGIFSFSL